VFALEKAQVSAANRLLGLNLPPSDSPEVNPATPTDRKCKKHQKPVNHLIYRLFLFIMSQNKPLKTILNVNKTVNQINFYI
jgi:hypothetical protein